MFVVEEKEAKSRSNGDSSGAIVENAEEIRVTWKRCRNDDENLCGVLNIGRRNG